MSLTSSLISVGLFSNLAFCILPVTSIANAQDSGKKVILSPNAPNPIGPYSQAVQVGNTVYLAGQGAIDPTSNQPMASASIEDQTRRTLDNLKAVLEAGGLTMDHIVSTIYSSLGIDWSKKIVDTPSGRAYEYQQTAPLGGPAFIPLTEINELYQDPVVAPGGGLIILFSDTLR